MIDLRNWQKECSSAVLNSFKNGNSISLVVAAPGAGKTIMTAEVTKQLFASKEIDYVLFIAPSVSIATTVESVYESYLEQPFDGQFGSKGLVKTIQSFICRNTQPKFLKRISKLFKSHKVLVIIDEIHHFAGDESSEGNAWGKSVLQILQGMAKFTLVMSGTPWRTDRLRMAMVNYEGEPATITSDYQYGLVRAVKDGVCRSPKIALLDGNTISLNATSNTERFENFSDLLKNSKVAYQDLLNDDNVQNQLLADAILKLKKLRIKKPWSAGLVVASSVEHANQIASLLIDKFGESAITVNYRQQDPHIAIEHFRTSTIQWIVSVGMISEGTDISRLQVCCYLTHIKTELYFRQVLGRVIRVHETPLEQAWLFAIAVPEIIEYSERIAQDLPGDYVIEKTKLNEVHIQIAASSQKNNDESIEQLDSDLNSSSAIKNGITMSINPAPIMYRMINVESYRSRLLAI